MPTATAKRRGFVGRSADREATAPAQIKSERLGFTAGVGIFMAAGEPARPKIANPSWHTEIPAATGT
jgi:hypothetical protein